MPEQLDVPVEAKQLRFSQQLEKLFLEEYYNNSIGLCRAALGCSTLLFMVFGFLDPYAIPSNFHQVWLIRFGVVLPVLTGVFALSFTPVFRRVMQLALGFVIIVTGFGLIGMTNLAKPDELGFLLYPMGLLLVPIVGYCFVRLRFWAATISNWLNVFAYLSAAIGVQHILQTPRGVASIICQEFFIISVNVVGMATCYSLELYARRAFVANYQLEQARAKEERKRQQSEEMLLVLSRAIGGVVHDLGNPLTSVQVGVQTLELYLESGLNSFSELKDLTGIINQGAQMLNHLRLSLMEQTRVLEGKPIPVHLAPSSLRATIEAGANFQKPGILAQRSLELNGLDIEIEADAMKFSTVWMNLIGNALKYSDGQVRVEWRVWNEWVLVAVGDQGRNGQGITREQAAQLFVAFGRLESHEMIEGTGLGLLSARKIVEAHGGQAFIEGRSSNGETFSTSSGDFPLMLSEEMRTAFVVALPLR